MAFSEREITKGMWVKISEHGASFLVIFEKGGRAIETKLIGGGEEWWDGRWRLNQDHDTFSMSIDRYLLVVRRGSGRSIHQGMEFWIKDDGEVGEPTGAFAIIHLPDD
jgi:hypothetical protein